MPHECTTCGRQFDDGSKEMLSGCPNCGGNKFQFQPPDRSPEPDEPASPADTDPVESEEPSLTDQSDAPSTAEPGETAAAAEPAEPVSDPESAGDVEPTGGTGPADNAVDAAPAESTPADEEFRDAEIADDTGAENSAQRDARSAAASPDEIDEARRRVADAESEAPSDGESEVPSDGRGRGTPQGPPTETPSGADPDEFALSGALGPEDDEPVEKQPVAGSAPEREEPVTDEDTDLRALREELNQQFESIKITAPGQYELNLMELYDRKEYIISLQEDGRYVIEMADDYGIDD
ncbi:MULTISPECIES: OapC/ArvC family zinc-ribbon domain-containing protein [Halolamina]|uniref:Zn-ribbon containing protein n=1 Tax=Halolamina pelagica TaxID=699431 RepID=A0A1I5SL77_9EURY|nr:MULTISPECIES: Zn-ribbon containing protein [Halolamina]NHX37006.1 hypothetical protein [Halolamina sp. R1-12]SFP71462.1 hypothetical protein SAMN05216277_106173 [Halolamina pelagica]